MVLARVLVPAEYGTFKQAWLLAQTLALLLPLGMTQSLYYFVPRDPERRDRYVAQALWFHLVIGALAAAGLLVAGPLVGAWLENPELARLAPWIAAITGLQLAGAPLDVAWNAAGRIGASAAARVATELARAAAILAGATLGGDVEAVLAGIAVAHALRFAVSTAVIVRTHGLTPSRATLARQLAYALPFGLAFVLIVPQQQFHHYAVAAAVTPAVFAVYSVGTFQLPVVDILYTPVSELLQIGIAEQDGAGLPPSAGLPLFHEAVLQLSFAFLPMAGLLAVAAPGLVELLFSARYLDAVPIFRLGVLSAVLAALPLDGVMRARAQNRFMIGLSGAKLAGTAALVLGGLAAAGPFGALAGWLVAEALARAAMLVRAASLFGVSVREVLPGRALAVQAAAAGAAMPAAALALHGLPGPLVVRLAAAGLSFAAAYLLLASALGGMPAGWQDLLRPGRPRPVAVPEEP